MIKVAIIGAGRMGITHFSIINSHPDVIIDSVVDSSQLVLSIIKKYLQVKTYTDYNVLFSTNKPDAILVCTPSNLHFNIISSAANYGIHVFCEKPFTTKYSEGLILQNKFESLSLVNQVGYVNRFNDVFSKLKLLLDDRIIGKVIRFKSEMFSSTITKSDDGDNWRATRANGGGVVFEMASHAIDLVNYLIGKPNKIVGTSLNQIFSRYVEDAMSTTLLFDDGKSGTIYVNWCDSSFRKPTNKIEIFGDGGRVLADQHSLKIFLNEDNTKHDLRKGWNTLYITDIFTPVQFYVRGNEFTRQLYHFIDCVKGAIYENKCSFKDGVNTLDIIQKIFSDYEQNIKN